MSFPYKDVVAALQFVLLRMIYDNFSTIVHAGHRELVRNGGVETHIIYFGPAQGKFQVIMRRDTKARYHLDFLNVPFPLGERDFTVTLGRGKNLVNHRVMNDVGARLNAFLGDSTYAKKKSLLTRHVLEFASKDVEVAIPGWFSRMLGVDQYNFNGEIDKTGLPGLTLVHETKWKWFEGTSEVGIYVHLFGGVKEVLK